MGKGISISSSRKRRCNLFINSSAPNVPTFPSPEKTAFNKLAAGFNGGIFSAAEIAALIGEKITPMAPEAVTLLGSHVYRNNALIQTISAHQTE